MNSAGVAGLTSALLLSKNSNYRITVAAKHMPGDYDIEYASPWAGANYLPSVFSEMYLVADLSLWRHESHQSDKIVELLLWVLRL